MPGCKITARSVCFWLAVFTCGTFLNGCVVRRETAISPLPLPSPMPPLPEYLFEPTLPDSRTDTPELPDLPPPIEHVAPDEPGIPDEPTGVLHTVRPGETVWAIASAYHQSVREITEANNLVDVNRIRVGQRLLIPGATEERALPPRDPGAGSRSRSNTPSRGTVLLAWPVRGREILSRFGTRRGNRRHQGLDIRGRRGEPVTAAAAGKVTFSATMRGYGRTVILDHGRGLKTLYAHNSSLWVRFGERVSRGQQIATVGRTGNASTEHIHFEVRRRNAPVDPLEFLSPSVAGARPRSP